MGKNKTSEREEKEFKTRQRVVLIWLAAARERAAGPLDPTVGVAPEVRN